MPIHYEKKVKINSTNINRMNNHLHSQLNTKKKTYHIGNPGMEQAQKYGWV